MANKRPYTFAEATASQKPEQSILTDSQKNGVKNIPVTYFAKKADLDGLASQVNNKLPAVFEFSNPLSNHNDFYDALYYGKELVFVDGNGRRYKVAKRYDEDQYGRFVFECVDGSTLYRTIISKGYEEILVDFGEITSYDISSSISSAVSSEATARSNADTALGARIDAIPDATYIVGLGMETAGSKKVADFWTAYNAGRECKFKYEGELYSISKVIGTTIYCEYIFFTWSKAFSINGVGEYFGEPTIDDYDFKLKDEEIEESIPSATSELTNDSGFVADAPSDGKQYARKDGEWSEVVIPSTDWSDIGNKPDTFTPSAHTHTKDEITDLVVPSKTSDLQNDSGFTKNFVATYEVTTFASIKSAVDAGNVVVCDMNNERHELLNSSSTKITFAKSYESSGNVNQMTIWVNSDNTWGSSVSTLAKKSDIPTVPTKTSDLTNDSDFTTKAYVDGLVGDVESLLAAL